MSREQHSARRTGKTTIGTNTTTQQSMVEKRAKKKKKKKTRKYKQLINSVSIVCVAFMSDPNIL